jgi:hypothetical protein
MQCDIHNFIKFATASNEHKINEICNTAKETFIKYNIMPLEISN